MKRNGINELSTLLDNCDEMIKRNYAMFKRIPTPVSDRVVDILDVVYADANAIQNKEHDVTALKIIFKRIDSIDRAINVLETA